MKFFTTLFICLAGFSLSAQRTPAFVTVSPDPAVTVLTFNVSCAGKADGSMYARAEQPRWKLKMYVNAAFAVEYFIAGVDTFIARLPEGNYTFICQQESQRTDTIHSTIIAPLPVHSSATLSTHTPLLHDAVLFINTCSGASTYHWDFGDGTTSDATEPVHAYAHPGQYNVTLTAYNAAGCADVSMFTVNALPAPPLNAPLTFINAHHLAKSPAIHVQSADGNATVTSATPVTRFNVYSATGQLIFSGSGNSTSVLYQSPGLYIIHAEYSDGTVHSQQVLFN